MAELQRQRHCVSPRWTRPRGTPSEEKDSLRQLKPDLPPPLPQQNLVPRRGWRPAQDQEGHSLEMGLSLFLQSTARVIPTNQLCTSAISHQALPTPPDNPDLSCFTTCRDFLLQTLYWPESHELHLSLQLPLVSFCPPCPDNGLQKIPKFYLPSKDLSLNTQDRRMLAGNSDPFRKASDSPSFVSHSEKGRLDPLTSEIQVPAQELNSRP